MSDLVRCDKCKNELPFKTQKKRLLLSTIVERERYFVYHWKEDSKDGIKKDFHLCNSCKIKFDLWLNEESV